MSDDPDWFDTDDPRVNVVYNIIGHPEQLPTFGELDYYLRDLSPGTIQSALRELIDMGAVVQIRGDEGTFYGLTAEYRDELEAATETEHIAQEATLRTERPTRIEELMALKRPDWGPANAYADGGVDE